MVKSEKKVDRTKDDYPNAQYDDRRRWKRAEGRTVFYKQSAIRNRGNSQNGAWSLDGRKLSLTSGRDISGGWKSYVRETGGV